MEATGRRDGKTFQATHLFLTSLRTTPQALLQLDLGRLSIVGWHWIRKISFMRTPTVTSAMALVRWLPFEPLGSALPSGVTREVL